MVFIWEIIYQRKNGAYVINFDDFKSIGTHWIALYVNSENVTYFDGFVVELITKEVRKFIRNENEYNLWNTSIWFNNMWIFLCWIY